MLAEWQPVPRDPLMNRAPLFAVLCLFASPALAQQAILKNGSCPSGYNSSGNYCVPGSSAQPAIEKNGSCPSGYNSSGNYCLMGSSGHPAIHKPDPVRPATTAAATIASSPIRPSR